MEALEAALAEVVKGTNVMQIVLGAGRRVEVGRQALSLLVKNGRITGSGESYSLDDAIRVRTGSVRQGK